MKIRGTVARTWRWLRSRGARNAVVLLYHRICDDPVDPFGLAVSPQNFAAQMQHLAAKYRVVTLRTLAEELTERHITAGTVVVTFDDGYADNLHVAAPILDRTGVKATVFVASGVQGEEYWWDTLIRLLCASSSLPSALTVRDRIIELPSTVLAGSRMRKNLLERVHTLLQPLPLQEIQDVLVDLAKQIEDAPPKPVHRSCTLSELRELAVSKSVEIGAHTRSHPVLSTLSDAAQEEEIAGSKQFLEGLLSKPIEAFSYPYGQPGQYNSLSMSHVRRAGFRIACTARADTVCVTTDPLQVPRLWARNTGSEQFAALLRRWSGV